MSKVIQLDAAVPTGLTPELRSFIDRAIVPALVREYVRQLGEENSLALDDAKVDNRVQTRLRETASTEARQ